jgi:hypothetical protein
LQPEYKKEIQLSIWELTCPMMIFRRNQKLELLKQSKKVVMKKLSIENMIEKDFKMDQLAKYVLSEKQLKEYNSVSKVFIDQDIDNFVIQKYSDLKDVSALSEFNKSNFNLNLGTKNGDQNSKPI